MYINNSLVLLFWLLYESVCVWVINIFALSGEGGSGGGVGAGEIIFFLF